VTLTANQNIILRDIEPAWRDAVQATLAAAGLSDVGEISAVDRFSMACPALPLCGLAITGAPPRGALSHWGAPTCRPGRAAAAPAAPFSPSHPPARAPRPNPSPN
jgi:hypothetical protein